MFYVAEDRMLLLFWIPILIRELKLSAYIVFKG